MKEISPIKAFRAEVIYIVTILGIFGAGFVAFSGITSQLASIQTTIIFYNEQQLEIKNTVKSHTEQLGTLSTRVTVLEKSK